MKFSLKYAFLCLLLSGTVLLINACGEDEDPEPMTSCTDGIQNGDETGVDCGGTCTACPTCTDGIQNGDETGVDCGGANCPACPTCEDGTMNGDETGVDCGGANCPACPEGVQGKWQSSGTNVAPLLVNLFAVDSIWAEFRLDMTYTVHQFDQSGTMIVLEGTYAQTKSNVGEIWTITVNQTSPVAFTSSGIFEVTEGDPDEMKYEIVLEDGQNAPPTPEGGFGSTNGGALGTLNVQTYLRLD